MHLKDKNSPRIHFTNESDRNDFFYGSRLRHAYFSKLYFLHKNIFRAISFRSEAWGILEKFPTRGRNAPEEIHFHLMVTNGKKYCAGFTLGVTSRKTLIHTP